METGIACSLNELKQILELVHGTAAVEVMRMRKLQREIEACCPPPQPEPSPCFTPCSEPKFRPYDPQVPDYKPLPMPNVPGQPK